MLDTRTVQDAMKVEVAISSEMLTALEEWSLMYVNKATWLNTYIKSLNLPAAIASEIARSTTIEMEVLIEGSARADYLNDTMQIVTRHLRDKLEFGVAKGGLMVKPYISDDKLAFDFIQADQFYPVAFDSNGNITSCVFSDKREVLGSFYTRLELHVFANSQHTVRNEAFKGTSPDDLGQSVELGVIEAWGELEPEVTISDVDRPLFAYYKYPLANNIDPTSPLGVSAFSRSVDLIHQADQHWSDLLWEFESAKRALYVDVLAMDQDSDDKPILGNQRLYRTLKGSGQIGKDKALFEDWTPTIREKEMIAGLEAILKKIEFNCGLAYGTLSDPQTVDKTATEILSSKQRSAATVVDSQKALEHMLNDLLYSMDVWATLGHLSPGGVYEATYNFDDSIVVDADAQFGHDSQTVGMGAMSKTKFLERNYGLTPEMAQEWLTEADAQQPEEENDLFGE